MANGILTITDLWYSVHDSNDVFHGDHVHQQQITRRNVLCNTRSLLGESDTLFILYTSTGTGLRDET